MFKKLLKSLVLKKALELGLRKYKERGTKKYSS